MAAFLSGFLRVYSWIFEAILSLMAIAVSVIAFVIPTNALTLGWLPWTRWSLVAWLFTLGTVGLVCVLLAIAGKLRVLLFLFSLFVVVLLVRGFFLSSYAFDGQDQFERGVLLTAGAVLAFIGAWPVTRR